MADLELMDMSLEKESRKNRQIVLSRGVKPSAAKLGGKRITKNINGPYHNSRKHVIPLHMIGDSAGLSEQSRQRRKALASSEMFEDELDLFDDMEYAGGKFDSEEDDEEIDYAGGQFEDEDDFFSDEYDDEEPNDDDNELELYSNSKIDFAEGDIAHLNSNEKAEIKGLMKELRSLEAEDEESSMLPSGANPELDDLLEDLREEFPDEEYAEGKRWDSFKGGLSKKMKKRKQKRGRKQDRRADKLKEKRGKVLGQIGRLKIQIKNLEARIKRSSGRAELGLKLSLNEKKSELRILKGRSNALKRRITILRDRAQNKPSLEEFPEDAAPWVERKYAARSASEYHDMANYYTEARPTEVNWSELHFPISMKFTLNEAEGNPEVAQWSLGKLLENNKVIQKIFNSGEYLGDVVMHTIRHNAPVSLGFRATMADRPDTIFYEPNTCPTEAQVDLVHTHVTKQITGIPQIPGKETLRTRPDKISATFLDRYGTDWNMDKIRKDAVVPAGKNIAMPSSKSPLVGYLVMERQFLQRNLIDARASVPVNKEMAEKAIDLIEAGHKQVLRLNDLSNMNITAVRTTGNSWNDTTEVGNDLRLSSENDKNRIIDNRLASPIVVQGVLTVSRGKAIQIQPEQSLEDYNAEIMQQRQAAVNEHQILAQVAAETVEAHDQKTLTTAAKNAGYLVHEPEQQQQQQQQQQVEVNNSQQPQANVMPVSEQVHYIQDPESGVIYQSVGLADEAYQQQQQQQQ